MPKRLYIAGSDLMTIITWLAWLSQRWFLRYMKKSCIDLQNAQKYGKSSSTHISSNHEIAKASRIWTPFHWRLSTHDSQKQLSKIFPIHTYLLLWLRRFGVTGIIVAPRSVSNHVTHRPCIHFLQCTVCHHPLRNFTCKFQLRNVSKRTNLIMIWFKNDIPCIVRSETLKGHSDTSEHLALRALCPEWSSWTLRPLISQRTIHHHT